MAFVTGLLVIDAPASALNNAGADQRATTDNTVVVKKIRTPEGTRPYVSAQAFRYWLRNTLEHNFEQWVAAPVFREDKIAYTDANPIENWDDDLFGYMRAPSKKGDRSKNVNATPLEKNREITRVSPFRVSTLVSISPTSIINDFGTMSRHDGDSVPHEHEFYRAHLQGLFSLDLTSVGTFYDTEKVGYKNLDSNRRKAAQESNCQEVIVRKQKAWRLPFKERSERAATLIEGIAQLDGGAKQALHYTDVAPSVVFVAITRNGNHPFYRVFRSSNIYQTELHLEALKEILQVYQEDFLSDIYIGWAKGFLDEERSKLEKFLSEYKKSDNNTLTIQLGHPKQILHQLAKALRQEKNAGWYQ